VSCASARTGVAKMAAAMTADAIEDLKRLSFKRRDVMSLPACSVLRLSGNASFPDFAESKDELPAGQIAPVKFSVD